MERRSAKSLVVIAASAGGFEPLRRLLGSLPKDLPAAIAIVQHRGQTSPEVLPQLLEASTALRIRSAVDGDVLEAGTVYICPPGMHMTAEHSLRLFAGAPIQYVRPSADLMLTSAAETFGPRAVAVVLSGRGQDAAIGAIAISDAGGMVLAQDPESSMFPDMPRAALASGRAEPSALEQLGPELVRLVEAANASASETSVERTPPPPRTPQEKATATRLRVVIADDHRIVREGLRALLSVEPDIEVVAEAENGLRAFALVRELTPDVVVMDLGMPDLNGLDATRRIRNTHRRTKVVVLSARADPTAAAEALAAGANAYIAKSGAFAEVALAIRLVAAGRRYVTPRFAESVGLPQVKEQIDRNRVLTPGERELVQLVVEGKPAHEIARRLGVHEPLLAQRREQVMAKIGVETLLGLTRYAIREGLVSLDP